MTDVRNRWTTVVGAVLAGGQSRRMGRDKAMLDWDGRSLLMRAVKVLESVFDEVLVVAPRDRGYEDLGVQVVPDIRPGLGPLGGLHTALVHGRGKPLFILACDMPHVTDDLVRWVRNFNSDPAMHVVHGEAEAKQAFRDRLEQELGLRADVPQEGDILEL